MGEHREFIGSYEKMGEGVWSIDDQIADTSQEVVRCRECRRFVENATPNDDEHPHFCTKHGIDEVVPDGFCAWGERA